MGTWRQWLRQPQRVWLRRATFQIHLWTRPCHRPLCRSAQSDRKPARLPQRARSVSGNAARSVRREGEGDERRRAPRGGAARVSRLAGHRRYGGTDRAAAAAAGWAGRASAGRGGRGRGNRLPDPTALITVERDGEKKERLFSPYTGQDLGDSTTKGQFFIMWTVRLHDELLMDRPDGPWWNGLLSCNLHGPRRQRARRLVARSDALEAQPRDQVERRMAPHQLGSAQRARILAVSVHADVGSVRAGTSGCQSR